MIVVTLVHSQLVICGGAFPFLFVSFFFFWSKTHVSSVPGHKLSQMVWVCELVTPQSLGSQMGPGRVTPFHEPPLLPQCASQGLSFEYEATTCTAWVPGRAHPG